MFNDAYDITPKKQTAGMPRWAGAGKLTEVDYNYDMRGGLSAYMPYVKNDAIVNGADQIGTWKSSHDKKADKFYYKNLND